MSTPSKKEIRKVVLASLIGATIEWYDFFLYGVVAGIVFKSCTFPRTTPTWAQSWPTAPLPSAISQGPSEAFSLDTLVTA